MPKYCFTLDSKKKKNYLILNLINILSIEIVNNIIISIDIHYAQH